MDWPRLMKLRTAARFVDETPRDFARKVGRVYPPPRRMPGLPPRWLRDDFEDWFARAKSGRRLEF